MSLLQPGFWGRTRPLLPIALLVALLGQVDSRLESAEPGIEFNRDIRPILSDNCFACHGPDAGQPEPRGPPRDRGARVPPSPRR